MKIKGLRLASGVIDGFVSITKWMAHSPIAFLRGIHRLAKWIDSHEDHIRSVLHHVAFYMLVGVAFGYIAERVADETLNHVIVFAGIILNL